MPIAIPKVWVLIGDADASARDLLRAAVLNIIPDAKIIEATDGIEASLKISGQNFDLVILELALPKKGGLQIIKALRTTHESHRARHVLLIGSGMTGDEVRQQVSHVDFIKKPCNQDDVEAFLKLIVAPDDPDGEADGGEGDAEEDAQ